jgi:ABC-type nitrate/sulfonate/bicarbonate transport system substrate-binding protein
MSPVTGRKLGPEAQWGSLNGSESSDRVGSRRRLSDGTAKDRYQLPNAHRPDLAVLYRKEGGYYQKYGYDVSLVFGVHPAGIAMIVSGEAAMTAYTLEQAMIASSKDGSLVALGSPYKKSLFALMASKNITTIRDLEGKRVGVSQIGDAPYNYSIGLLGKAGVTQRDVEWIPLGTDANACAAALVSGRVDATVLTAPIYFKLEQEGFRDLGNISDHDDITHPRSTCSGKQP